jgi:hypothetical protein
VVDISKIIYRQAEEQDWVSVEEMVLDLCEELNDCYDIDEVRQDLKLLRSLPNFACFVAVDTHPVGCAAFIVGKELGKKNYCAYESFWFVEKEYRSGIGKELVNFVEKILNCDSIEFGISNPRLEALMKRSGYSVIKSLMRKEM